jgi:histidine triad (HIT) family protein
LSCVFCEIVHGQAAASRVHEDDHVLAFLDIRPVRAGQLLVIPKQHIDHFCDLPDDLATHILVVGQRLASVLRDFAKPERVGMIVHGFGVPHAHLIVLPLHHPWDITSSANAYLEGDAIKFRWDQVALASRNELDALAENLRTQLAGLAE